MWKQKGKDPMVIGIKGQKYSFFNIWASHKRKRNTISKLKRHDG